MSTWDLYCLLKCVWNRQLKHELKCMKLIVNKRSMVDLMDPLRSSTILIINIRSTWSNIALLPCVSSFFTLSFTGTNIALGLLLVWPTKVSPTTPFFIRDWMHNSTINNNKKAIAVTFMIVVAVFVDKCFRVNCWPLCRQWAIKRPFTIAWFSDHMRSSV